MSETLGSINFGNIPVAAPSGISILGARQGLRINGGYVELGSTDFGAVAPRITNERYIVLDGGALWALHVTNYGWRIQANEMAVINSGEYWRWIQDGAASLWRIESGANEVGIQWYNVGIPTGERAFVGYNRAGGVQNVVIRNSLSFPGSGILMQSNGGGDIACSIGGSQVLRASSTGHIYLAGNTDTSNYIWGNGTSVVINGGGFIKFLTNSGERLRLTTALFSSNVPFGIGGVGSGVATAWAQFGASTAARCSMNIMAGVSVTAPNDGDIWYDGTDLFMRVGGVTKTFTLV